MEAVGDSKLEIAAGGRGCSSKSKLYVLSRLEIVTCMATWEKPHVV